MNDTLARLMERLAEEGTAAMPERPDGGGIMSASVNGKGRLHIAVTADEQAAIAAEFAAQDAARAALMPDEKTAIKMLFEAHLRLKELGWREATYCPKDGSSFEVIEPGSTGIFPCHYYGEWPDGGWMVEQDGGCPSHPILFRLYPEDEAKRQAKMAEAAARFRCKIGA